MSSSSWSMNRGERNLFGLAVVVSVGRWRVKESGLAYLSSRHTIDHAISGHRQSRKKEEEIYFFFQEKKRGPELAAKMMMMVVRWPPCPYNNSTAVPIWVASFSRSIEVALLLLLLLLLFPIRSLMIVSFGLQSLKNGAAISSKERRPQDGRTRAAAAAAGRSHND